MRCLVAVLAGWKQEAHLTVKEKVQNKVLNESEKYLISLCHLNHLADTSAQLAAQLAIRHDT